MRDLDYFLVTEFPSGEFKFKLQHKLVYFLHNYINLTIRFDAFLPSVFLRFQKSRRENFI
jgi:hypothetical protein